MEKIPFNLEKYNTGEYDVVTRDERPARIICIDMMDIYPVVALVEIDDKTRGHVEIIHHYSVQGKFAYSTVDEPCDLFLIPKEKQEPRKETTDDRKLNRINACLISFGFILCEQKSYEKIENIIDFFAKRILEIKDDN